jgi:formamidopyrimidine-DNA glycosylase
MAIEYPEAVTISSQMREVLPGKSISTLTIRDPKSTPFRWGFSNLDKVDVRGEHIQAIDQFGDFIYVQMNRHWIMFGDMIGKILYHPKNGKRLPKSAIIFELDEGTAFSYNPSLYGYCRAILPEERSHFQKPGWIQPMDSSLTPDYLAKAFLEKERKIAKQMNIVKVDYKVVGVGNGYWQEILYLAGVHPQRKAADITPTEIESLCDITMKVMENATALKGSVEEVDFFGKAGEYARQMGGRLKGMPCRKCGTEIAGKSILGANVYFCPTCQK